MPADPDGNPINLTFIFLMVIFFIISIIYAASESLFLNLNENKVKRDAEGGNPKAKRILRLLNKHSSIPSHFQSGMALFGMAFSTISVITFAPQISNGTGLHLAASIAIMIIASTLVFFIFADFLPKRIMTFKASNYSYGASGMIVFLYSLMIPYLVLVNACSNAFMRLFGFDPGSLDETVTEEEIMMIVGEGEEKGVIEETEKDMIENILDFNDTTASEIMTHRTDISAVEDTASISELVELGIEEGRSRIPIYHDDIDSIIGICYVKDLLPYVGKEIPEFISLKDIVRPAYYIPETKKCSHLFSEMTERKVQIAIIVDEYGGTSGLITLEDLVESILGNIQDEYDNEEDEIKKVSEHEFTVDGATSIDEISDLTDTELPEGDYDTIAGFVTDRLGRILKEDEHPVIEENGLKITVLEVEEQRISKLLIQKEPDESETKEDSGI